MKRRIKWLLAIGFVVVASGRLPAQVTIDSEAYSGVPFGMGRVTISSGGDFRVRLPRPGAPRGGRIVDLAKRLLDQPAGGQAVNLVSGELTLVERANRVFYPVFEKRERALLREFVNAGSQSTILFLFQGDAPLDVSVYAPQATSGQIAPRRDPAGHDRLLRAWWNDYSAAAHSSDNSKEYPPMVEEYLADTLARRLNLRLPARDAARDSGIFRSELNLLGETETARLEMAQAVLLDQLPHEPAAKTLPEELPQPKPELLNRPDDAPIEPLAKHVPVECLYVRFGSFSNFLWLRHRMEEWGGELRDVISSRGLEFKLNDRMQGQLGLKDNALAELLGDRVIADVALIGTDTFMHDGAAMGTLLQAKSNPTLATSLAQQRLAALKEAGGKQEMVEIAGKKVSFMSTFDNTLRSFYTSDGDFHLVTNSRKLVEWFLATGAGNHASLGDSDEFKLARARLPLARNDTVFVYLSPAFFQNLLGAPYQIELKRRLRSSIEIELFEIAQLAAQSEGQPCGTIDELVAGGFLPKRFAERSDGSALELVDGRMVDTQRGARGTFMPIPDVGVDRITVAEAEDYQRLAESYVNDLGPIDPVVAAIGRKPLKDSLEQVTLDMQAAPLSQRHTELLARWLGEPTDQRLAPLPGDVVAFEAVVRGGSFFPGGEHHLFGALRDGDPAMASDPRVGLIARLFASQLQGLNGYIGAWPDPGFLRFLGGFLNQRPDPAGYTRMLTGLWRRQFGQFTLMSFHPEVLAQVSPQLKFIKAERPAQVWVRADDLAHSQLAPLLNAYGYRETRKIAEGNTRYLNMLSEQLHVAQSEARAIGERLLKAKLISPLGGDYELREFPGGPKVWVSTALLDQARSETPPADYQFPALNWLRGIQLEVRAVDGLLAAHGEFIMPAETKPSTGFQFPSLPFGKPSADPAKTKPQPQLPKSRLPAKPAKPAPSDVKQF